MINTFYVIVLKYIQLALQLKVLFLYILISYLVPEMVINLRQARQYESSTLPCSLSLVGSDYCLSFLSPTLRDHMTEMNPG